MKNRLKNIFIESDEVFLNKIINRHKRRKRFNWFFEIVSVFDLIISLLFLLFILWLFITPIIYETVFEYNYRLLVGLSYGIIITGCLGLIIISFISFFKLTRIQRTEKILREHYYKLQEYKDNNSNSAER